MTVLLICTQLLQILKTQWTNIVSNSVRPFDIILQVPGPRSLRLTKGYSMSTHCVGKELRLLSSHCVGTWDPNVDLKNTCPSGLTLLPARTC